MIHYRLSKHSDCQELAPNLRQADKDEVLASNGLSPLEALQASYEVSQDCYTITDREGKTIGMFGVADNGVFSSPWMLASDGILSIQKAFLRQGKEWVEDIAQKNPVLINYVHRDNDKAIRWLKFLGFTFTTLVPEYGVGKGPFYQFVRVTPNV